MATPSKATLLSLCLLILSTHATSAMPSSLRRGLTQMASKKGDYVTIQVPKSSQEASRQVASQGLPSETDVSSLTTLPTIDSSGKEMPRETLKVSFTDAGERVVKLVPKKTNSASKPPPLLPLQSSDTLGRCNVAPPPFRTLPSFEDTGSLANGVASLLYYRNNRIVAFCSGWLIHPKRVVTAAHCVYSHDTRHYFWDDGMSLSVSIGLNGMASGDRYSSAFVTSVTLNRKYPAYSSWSQSLVDGTDTAVLKLSSSLSGKTYGWSSPRQGVARMVLGYPAASQSGFDQIGDIIADPNASPRYGCVSGTGSNILCEDLSTEGGHSGSAIFSAYNSDVVVGTLSGGVRGACPTLFTLALPQTSSASSVTSLATSAGCQVGLSGGVSRVTSCT